jgi:hypothetical protein
MLSCGSSLAFSLGSSLLKVASSHELGQSFSLQYAVYDAVAAYAWDIQDEVQEYHQILGRLGAFEQRLLYVLGETTVCISRDYCMYVASSYCTSTLHAHLALQTEQHYHA